MIRNKLLDYFGWNIIILFKINNKNILQRLLSMLNGVLEWINICEKDMILEASISIKTQMNLTTDMDSMICNKDTSMVVIVVWAIPMQIIDNIIKMVDIPKQSMWRSLKKIQ